MTHLFTTVMRWTLILPFCCSSPNIFLCLNSFSPSYDWRQRVSARSCYHDIFFVRLSLGNKVVIVPAILPFVFSVGSSGRVSDSSSVKYVNVFCFSSTSLHETPFWNPAHQWKQRCVYRERQVHAPTKDRASCQNRRQNSNAVIAVCTINVLHSSLSHQSIHREK